MQRQPSFNIIFYKSSRCIRCTRCKAGCRPRSCLPSSPKHLATGKTGKEGAPKAQKQLPHHNNAYSLVANFPGHHLISFKSPCCGSAAKPVNGNGCRPPHAEFGDRGLPGTSLDPRPHRLPRAEIATTTALSPRMGHVPRLNLLLFGIRTTAKRRKRHEGGSCRTK